MNEYPTLLTFDQRPVPQMPQEYLGATHEGCGYTESQPREWTDDEVGFLQMLKEQGYTLGEIAESLGRTETSVSIKLKRIGKVKDTYNDTHRNEKYEANMEFFKRIKPKTILDLYCGTESFWSTRTRVKVTTNDINESIRADYHRNADRLIADLYSKDNRFDIIDLDPFGSAYDCFDLAFKMANKGIIVTFGEMGHKRWKRLDFVRYHYGIVDLSEFTTDRLVAEFRRIGLRNKKDATPVIVKEWPRISRVYFEIQPMKITEQWL